MNKIDDNDFNSPISIGDLAKKMGITVQTLQYYDKQGILVPSAVTAGRKRYYTKQDMIKLHQILSLKYLGFSLEDIKKQLIVLQSPQDVAETLELQCQMFRQQITKMNQVLSDTEVLLREVRQMNQVDFDRYANIVILLQQKSDSYWLFKLFSDKIFSHINQNFSENPQAWVALYKRWNDICDETIRMEQLGESPESSDAQLLAQRWWDITLEFLGGDLTLLDEIRKFEENFEGWDEEMKKKVLQVKYYRKRLLEVYFSQMH